MEGGGRPLLCQISSPLVGSAVCPGNNQRGRRRQWTRQEAEAYIPAPPPVDWCTNIRKYAPLEMLREIKGKILAFFLKSQL